MFDSNSANQYRNNNHKFFENTEVMDISEAADFLRMSTKFLRKLVRDGKIPHKLIAERTVRFSRTELCRWLRKE